MGDQSHLADGGAPPETAQAQCPPALFHYDGDAPFQDEMHAVSGITLAGNDLARGNVTPGAVARQSMRMAGIAQRLGQPVQQ